MLGIGNVYDNIPDLNRDGIRMERPAFYPSGTGLGSLRSTASSPSFSYCSLSWPIFILSLGFGIFCATRQDKANPVFEFEVKGVKGILGGFRVCEGTHLSAFVLVFRNRRWNTPNHNLSVSSCC